MLYFGHFKHDTQVLCVRVTITYQAVAYAQDAKTPATTVASPMEQCPPVSRSDGQEIPCLLWKPKVRYRVHIVLYPNPSQFNPHQTLTSFL
jgi:hypothetical protein